MPLIAQVNSKIDLRELSFGGGDSEKKKVPGGEKSSKNSIPIESMVDLSFKTHNWEPTNGEKNHSKIG